jgi:CubicO group peptidase (beta-lactamase class C family)
MKLRSFPAALLSVSLSLALPLSIAHCAFFPLAVQAEESGKLDIKTDFAKSTISEAQVQTAIAEIDKLAQKQIDQNVVPGMAISVVHNDKVVFAKGYGVRAVGKSEKVDPDTVFQIASISKSVGSTVVAAAVGEKTVSWDSKISDLDPGFALSEPWVTSNLTIRDLYAHRSGLPAHAGDILEDLGYSQAEVLHHLRYQKPSSSMRSEYAYTNFGLTEAALATAKAARTDWESLSEEKLYKPLGMSSTSSRFSDFSNRSNRAVGHMMLNGKWAYRKQRRPDAQSPAGGVSSSVNDMSKWMRLQINNGKFEGKQIIDEAAIAETHIPQMRCGLNPINGLPEFYGLGFNVSYDKQGRLILSHSGGFALGAATNVKMLPSEKLGVCVLTNAAPIGVAEGMASTFTDLALYGSVKQDWLAIFKQVLSDPAMMGESVSDVGKRPAAPVPPLKNEAYLGTYENDLYGKLEVTMSVNGLMITVGKDITAAMTHYDRDTFTYEIFSENLSGPSGISFAIGTDGKAKSVIVENLNGNGQGLFIRSQTK